MCGTTRLNLDAERGDIAGIGTQQAVDDLDQGRFAAATCPEHGRCLTGGDGQ